MCRPPASADLPVRSLPLVTSLLALALVASPALAQTYRIDPSDLDPAQAPPPEDDDELVPWRKKAPRDTEPPEVEVSVPPGLVAGQQLFMSVRVTDASDVLVATLYWRYVGDPSWTVTNLTGRDGRFVSRFRVDRPFEYYVEAYDQWGNGPGLAGSEEAPRQVAVRTPEVHAPAAPKPAPKPPEVKKPLPPPPVPMPSGRVLRVATAREIVPGRFEVALDGALLGGSDFLSASSSVLGLAGEARVSWGALPQLELSLAASARQASLKLPSGTTFESGSGVEPTFGARYLSPALGPVRFALLVSMDLHPPVATGSWAASTEALAAITWAPSPVRVSAHAGYRFDNSENGVPGQWSPFGAFAMDLSRFDLLRVGAAVEAQLRSLVPFVEYTLDMPVDRRAFASCDGAPDACRTPPPSLPAAKRQLPQRVGAGLRFELASTVSLQAAAELSLTPAGRNLSSPDARAFPAPESYALPAPWAVRVSVRWQFGKPLPDPRRAPPAPEADSHDPSDPSDAAAAPAASEQPATVENLP